MSGHELGRLYEAIVVNVRKSTAGFERDRVTARSHVVVPERMGVEERGRSNIVVCDVLDWGECSMIHGRFHDSSALRSLRSNSILDVLSSEPCDALNQKNESANRSSTLLRRLGASKLTS